MKRTFIFIMCIVFTLLCGCSDKETPSNEASGTAAGNESGYEELKTFTDKWINEQQIIPLESYDLSFSHGFFMKEGENQKLLNDIIVDVDIFYNSNELEGVEYELIDSFFSDMVSGLTEETDNGGQIINTINLVCYDSKGGKERNRRCEPFAQTHGAIIDNGRNDETDARTVVFEFTEDAFPLAGKSASGNPYQVTLRRFGVDAETLFIEIGIYVPGIITGQIQDDYKTELEEKSGELLAAITEDKSAMKYLEENQVENINISFYTSWEAKSEYSYTHSVVTQ